MRNTIKKNKMLRHMLLAVVLVLGIAMSFTYAFADEATGATNDTNTAVTSTDDSANPASSDTATTEASASSDAASNGSEGTSDSSKAETSNSDESSQPTAAVAAVASNSLSTTLADASGVPSLSRPSNYTDFSSAAGNDYVYLFLNVANVSSELQNQLHINSDGWFTVGRIRIPDGMLKANNSTLRTTTVLGRSYYWDSYVTSDNSSRYCWGDSSQYVNSAYRYQTQLVALVKSYVQSGSGIEYFTTNESLISQFIQGIDWEHFGLCISDGDPSYGSSGYQWHLDGYLDLAYSYNVVYHYDDDGDGTYERTGSAQTYSYQSSDANTDPTSSYTTQDGYTYVPSETNWVDHNGNRHTTAFSLNTLEPVITGSTNGATLNLYFKKNASLTIFKQIAGGAADPNASFEFVLSGSTSDGSGLTGSYGYTCSDGTSGVLTFEDGAASENLTIPAGGSVTITNLPIGATISVKETGLSGNAGTKTESQVDGSSTWTDLGTAVTESRPVDVTTASAKTSTVTFKNTSDLVPDTGLNTTNSTPMIALLGAAAAGGLALAVTTTRKRNGERKES